MHHLALHLIGYNHVNCMPLTQALFVKSCSIVRRVPSESHFVQTRTANITCPASAICSNGNPRRRPIWLAQPCVVLVHNDTVRPRAPRPAPLAPIVHLRAASRRCVTIAQSRENPPAHDFRRMQTTQTLFYRFINRAIVRNRGLQLMPPIRPMVFMLLLFFSFAKSTQTPSVSRSSFAKSSSTILCVRPPHITASNRRKLCSK